VVLKNRRIIAVEFIDVKVDGREEEQ